MNKFYNKSELWFSIFWIILYIVMASLGDKLSSLVGIEQIFTFFILLTMATILITWTIRNGHKEKYGLTKPTKSVKAHLYFIPLIIMISINLWFGVNTELKFINIIFPFLTMLMVGVVEEIVFRGLLFRAMEKDSPKAAIIVSSITFGFGHIINLLSSGLDNLLPNICQVLYATAAGFMFVIIFYKGGSLLPCIITHSLFNAMSVFSSPVMETANIQIITAIVLIIIPTVYSLILLKTLKADSKSNIEEIESKE